MLQTCRYLNPFMKMSPSCLSISALTTFICFGCSSCSLNQWYLALKNLLDVGVLHPGSRLANVKAPLLSLCTLPAPSLSLPTSLLTVPCDRKLLLWFIWEGSGHASQLPTPYTPCASYYRLSQFAAYWSRAPDILRYRSQIWFNFECWWDLPCYRCLIMAIWLCS